MVKLIDVYPEDYPDPDPNPAGIHMGGFQQLVRGEMFRGKFRNSFSKPEPFTPGQDGEDRVRACRTSTTAFRKGHRIMMQIQSSWFPLADRNPQKFVDINTAKASRFREGHAAGVPVGGRGILREGA